MFRCDIAELPVKTQRSERRLQVIENKDSQFHNGLESCELAENT